MRSRKNCQTFYTPAKVCSLSVATAILAFFSISANAQWHASPSIGIGAEHDDNASLNAVSGLETSVEGLLVQVDAAFTYNSPLTEFSIVPTALLRRYNGDSDLDSDDYFLDLNHFYKGERSTFGIRGGYSSESERTAERAGVDFDVEDPGNIPEDDSGRVLRTERRERLMLKPDWTYQVGQRSIIRIGARFIDVTYDDRQVQDNSDYAEVSGSIGYEYRLSERSGITVDGYVREDDFDFLNRDSSGYGGMLGFNRSLTENSRISLKVGADSTEDSLGISHSNPIGEISVVRRFETSRILANYRRTVSGSGAGTVSLRDSASLNFSRDISQKVTLGVGIRAYSTDALDDDLVNFDERDYVQIAAMLRWKVSRVLTMEFDYRYTDLDRRELPSSADSNLFQFWIRYHPRSIER